jgi:hypothetical protein
MAIRGKSPKNGYTTLEQAYAVISDGDPSVSYADAREVLRKLSEIGCGSFVLGRRDWPTRLVWTVNAINCGKAARGELADLSEPTSEDAVPADMHEHSFVLRDDLTVTLRLPKDLTEKEAARLARFVEAIPK